MQVNLIGSPALVDEGFELGMREKVADGLLAQWSIFDAVGYGKMLLREPGFFRNVARLATIFKF